MSFSRTPSGVAAKYLFVYVKDHTDVSHHPIQQDSRRKKKPRLRLDWRLKGISGPVYST